MQMKATLKLIASDVARHSKGEPAQARVEGGFTQFLQGALNGLMALP